MSSSCCSASKRRNTDSSPCPSIHQHQCGPDDRRLPHHWQPDSNDMETDQLPTSRPFSSRPVRGNQQTATHIWHRPLVYVKEEGLAPKHRKRCSVPQGRDGAERRRDEPDADKFRDLGVGTSGWIRRTPMGVLSQNVSRQDDADKQADWL